MTDNPSIFVPTLKDALAELRALLPVDSPLNDRDPFGVWETYTTLAAQVLVDDRATLNALMPQLFPVTATGVWLDHHAKSLGLSRIPASRACHQVYFEVRASGTVPAGSIVQTELDSSGHGLRFSVPVETEVQHPGGFVEVVAEQPGSRYNIGKGRIQTLVTVLPFVVSVHNDAGSLVEAGVDEESDTLLRERLLLRWPAISRGSTYHAYVSWAREVPGIVKVQVLDEHPRGQGTVDVVVAPASGLPTPEQLAAVDAVVQARRPLTADVQVRTPVTQQLPVDLTLYLRPGTTPDHSIWQARIQGVFDSLGIGETLYPSKVADVLHNYSDVLGVDIRAPAHPTRPSGDELIVAGDINVVIR